MNKKYYITVYAMLYFILILIITQGLFHHDAVQLYNAIENNDISGIVNGRYLMFFIYYPLSIFGEIGYIFTNIILSMIMLCLLYNYYDKNVKYTIIASLLPPVISLISYPNSNIPVIILSLMFLMVNNKFMELFIIIIGIFIRPEILFLLIYKLYIRKKFYYLLFFIILSPAFLFLGSNSSDFKFNINPFLLILLCFGVIPILFLSRNEIISLLVLILPFTIIGTVKMRMLVIPSMIIIKYLQIKNINYKVFIPMLIISLNLIFSYVYYDNVMNIIYDNKLSKNYDAGDYTVFFKHYGYYDGNCINHTQQMLLYHNSDIFPTIFNVNIECPYNFYFTQQ